eukprot:TRINITY_DN9639_c0_g1_i1.p1 TRINITY_DN9639_c0_g1~~TRINITY_DN9639_c0_g1_i1.p1  ORF type:complete len:749 (-),score=219.34 TRINITY_DN9639_c0_g1_i1:353-2599(-)
MTLFCKLLLVAVVAPSFHAVKLDRYNARITPTEKVVKLLNDLHDEVQTDGEAENTTYEEFHKFCTKTEDEKIDEVKKGKDDVATTAAALEEKKGLYDSEIATVNERKTSNEQIESELSEHKKLCDKERKTYLDKEADLSKACAALDGALGKLRVAAPGAGSLLQVGSELQEILAVAEAMGFLEEPKRKASIAFLQSARKVDPWLDDQGEEWNKGEFKYEDSGGIVDTLEELHADFSGERDKVRSEWDATKKSCEDTQALKTAKHDRNDDDLKVATENAAKLKREMAEAKQENLQARTDLKEDEEYLAELQELCTSKAQDYKQRVKSRLSEMAALKQAIRVMQDSVTALDRTVNGEMAPSFLQEVMQQNQELEKPHQQVQGQLVQMKLSEEEQLVFGKAKKVASLLAAKGKSLQSFRLKGLAVRMENRAEPAAGTTATDTLKVVKDMVQDLINELVDTAQKEVTEKGFCDTHMGEQQKERDRRLREALRQNAKMGSLDSKRTGLLEEISILGDQIAETQKDIDKAVADRYNESASNLATINAAREARQAVKAATVQLQDFYAGQKRKAKNYDVRKAASEEAQKAASESLLQADPRALSGQPAAGAGFEGSYGGRQGAALSITALMEVIAEDFERTEIETTKDEDKASEEFVTWGQDTKVYLQKKKTKNTLLKEDLADTENELEKGKKALESTVGLLNGALEILMELKPRCVDNKMTYDERMAKREAEMDALKRALCMLDKDGVEEKCKD